MNAPTGIEAQVCQDIADRQAHGLAKYGVSVADHQLTHAQWLEHAYQEALDLAIYLKRAMFAESQVHAMKNYKFRLMEMRAKVIKVVTES